MSPERLAEITTRADAATRCTKAAVNGREDELHTWSAGSFTHQRCELCKFIRPRGERAEETTDLLAEVARLRAELAARPSRGDVLREVEGKLRWLREQYPLTSSEAWKRRHGCGITDAMILVENLIRAEQSAGASETRDAAEAGGS
jgi:hypothetical protein